MNNPSAFPLHPEHYEKDESGMTLRDYFAAASIQTAMRMVKHDLQEDEDIFYWNKSEIEMVASRAYDVADAMLKAREQ
jgi:hypothetical protein